MDSTIILREYKPEDAACLADIIRRTWHYDRFCSPKTAKAMGRLYLMSCLKQQSFHRVAVKDGVPAGVIMARDYRCKPALHFLLPFAAATLPMLANREGRGTLRAFSGIEKVNRDLLQNRDQSFTGELCFFAVDESCRGTGIGKMLFAQVLSYMQEQRIDSFFLYTDSSCNYGFYEHQGMKRCGETAYRVPVGIENEMKFFLYEYAAG